MTLMEAVLVDPEQVARGKTQGRTKLIDEYDLVHEQPSQPYKY